MPGTAFAAAPGIVRPLRLLQIIEIAAADFRVLMRETGFAVPSMSPTKANAAGSRKISEIPLFSDETPL
jgi:hypothetical protein